MPPQFRARVADVARSAFTGGLNDLFFVAAIVAVIGAVLALALVRQQDFQTDVAHAAAA